MKTKNLPKKQEKKQWFCPICQRPSAKGKSYCRNCKKEKRKNVVEALLTGDVQNSQLWCEKKNVHLGVLGYIDKVTARKKVPNRVRCPKCKKRFKPYVKECADAGCLHWYLPRHKLKS